MPLAYGRGKGAVGVGMSKSLRNQHLSIMHRTKPRAQVIEARSGETERLDPKGESAVPEGGAPHA